MKITVFAKKRTTRSGKEFYSFLTKLPKKDGTGDVFMTVHFRDECGAPKPEDCPLNIEVEKVNANISSKLFNREDTGEPYMSYNLWVSKWTPGEPYVDTSLDEFDV